VFRCATAAIPAVANASTSIMAIGERARGAPRSAGPPKTPRPRRGHAPCARIGVAARVAALPTDAEADPRSGLLYGSRRAFNSSQAEHCGQPKPDVYVCGTAPTIMRHSTRFSLGVKRANAAAIAEERPRFTREVRT
jgi:hypothetical protein